MKGLPRLNTPGREEPGLAAVDAEQEPAHFHEILPPGQLSENTLELWEEIRDRIEEDNARIARSGGW